MPHNVPSWWYRERVPLVAAGLAPLAALYGAVVVRRFCASQPYRSALPVLCIGNFTMGGAGKTPVALHLASLLETKGWKPAFLSRGYGGTEAGPHRVRAGEDVATRVGDEPLLLARTCTTVVSRDRPAGAKHIRALGADVIVMDDGFQNPSLEKDFSLVVVDGGVGIGSGQVFPLGPLRAPLTFQASRASALLILGEPDQRAKTIAALGQRVAELPEVFQAETVPTSRPDLENRRFVAFCGIGRPTKFFETLKKAGVSVVAAHGFPDHHRYSDADARRLLAEAQALEAGLITTEKDWVRLLGQPGRAAELRAAATTLPIGLRFHGDDEQRLLDALIRALERAAAARRTSGNTPNPDCVGVK